MELDPTTYRLKLSGKPGLVSLIVGLVGLALSFVGYKVDADQMFHSYLTAFVFWVSIALGGLFFTMLHHLVNAKWSIVLRRLSESVMICLPFMALLFIPVLLGLHHLYHWSDAAAVAADDILQKKAGYLNPTFFVIRSIGYFVIWSLFAVLLYRISLREDKKHEAGMHLTMRRLSAGGMVLFALTSTFAAFDWLMSLDAHWYSTIFGVYVFSGSFLAILSFVILAAGYVRRHAGLRETITVEHFHDLGKLTFAFIIFWAYMAFSQYFLMWYANIPEETVWYLHRWANPWKYVSLVIIFGHFVVPFIALLTRIAKRTLAFLSAVAVWILLMRWVDLYWLVMPNLHQHEVHLSWMDLTTMIGIGGLFLWFFWRRFISQPLVPVGDPGLQESIQFVNR